MADLIEIQFWPPARSRAKTLRIIKGATQFVPGDDSTPCKISLDKSNIETDCSLFIHAWRTLRKRTDTAVYANGKILTREQAEAIFDWLRCFANREHFPDQDHYCCITPGIKSLHGWGCKWLHSIARHGNFGRHRGVPWYSVGPLEDKVQYIDKQDIKDKLEDEAKCKCLEICPHFSLKKAFEYVDMLPDSIDPREDSDWMYVTSDDPTNKHEIIGVEPYHEFVPGWR